MRKATNNQIYKANPGLRIADLLVKVKREFDKKKTVELLTNEYKMKCQTT